MMKVMKDFMANGLSFLSVSISMLGTLNELITALVLLSALSLNLSRMYYNHRKKEDDDK